MRPKLIMVKSFALIFLALSLTALLGAVTRAEVVNFKQLLPFVEIKLPGWSMQGKPDGTTVKQGDMMVSEARATYRAGDKTLEVTVMDFLGKSFPFLGEGQLVEVESSEETVRSSKVQDFKAIETYRPREHNGELNIAVADRFWMKIEGDGIDSFEVLKTAAAQIDLKKLAGLAK